MLRQFRHISLHTGMLNGLTVERTGKFPIFIGGEDTIDKLKNGLFDE